MEDKLAGFRAMARNVRKSTTIALWVCLIISISLFVASFLVPPMGEIHPTVLRAVGEIFGIMGLIVLREAIMEGLGVKMTHGNTSIEIKDLDAGTVEIKKSENEDENGED